MAALLMQSAARRPRHYQRHGGCAKPVGRRMPLGAIAAALLAASHPRRQGREPGPLRRRLVSIPPHQVYPYGSHLAVVKVETPDTGAVRDRALCQSATMSAAPSIPCWVEGQIRRRLRPRALGGRAHGGFSLQRARRSAVRDLRGLSDGRRRVKFSSGNHPHRGFPRRPQSARHQGRPGRRAGIHGGSARLSPMAVEDAIGMPGRYHGAAHHAQAAEGASRTPCKSSPKATKHVLQKPP